MYVRMLPLRCQVVECTTTGTQTSMILEEPSPLREDGMEEAQLKRLIWFNTVKLNELRLVLLGSARP